MRVAETSGRSVDEAVDRALDQLGLSRDQVDVDVVSEGKSGFLGLGSEDAIVRVTAKDSAPTPAQQGRGGGDGRRRGRRGGRGRGSRGRDGGGRDGGEQSQGERDGNVRDANDDAPGARGEVDEPSSPPEERSDRERGDRGGRGRGGRSRGGRGRGGRGGNGDRPRRDDEPVERIVGVSAEEQLPVPGAPDELPETPDQESEDHVDFAGSMLRDVLTFLGLTGTEIAARDPETPGDGEGLVEQVFDIYADDDETADELGLLIGRRGETMSALQYLVNTAVSRRTDNEGPIFAVDIEGYHRRREQTLVELAQEVASEVRSTGDVITLEPMPAAERRIIHLTLQEEEGVRTESVGSGDHRQVEVLPAD